MSSVAVCKKQVEFQAWKATQILPSKRLLRGINFISIRLVLLKTWMIWNINAIKLLRNFRLRLLHTLLDSLGLLKIWPIRIPLTTSPPVGKAHEVVEWLVTKTRINIINTQIRAHDQWQLFLEWDARNSDWNLTSCLLMSWSLCYPWEGR